MKFDVDFLYLLRKYTVARIIALLVICFAILGFSVLINYSIKEKPVILNVSKQVGSPGDTISIQGRFFQKTKGSSYVEIAGSRLTESSYVSWTDSEIVIVIPSNTQDGLLYVVSNVGRSNPDFFANKTAIPISIPQTSTFTRPVITSLSAESLYIGELLTITGKNFGTKKQNTHVWFSTKKTSQQVAENSLNQKNVIDDSTEYIHASNADFDYEFWSENEIRVFVPDGAFTGYVYVENENGSSSKHTLTVKQRAGTKDYIAKTIYLVQTSADVSNIKGTKDSVLTLRLPLPQITADQPVVTLTETLPKPLIDDFDNTAVFQIAMDKTENNTYATAEKTKISQNHVITVRSVKTLIDVNYVAIPTDRRRLLYKTFTKADAIVPADTPELVNLLPLIIYQSKNPYRQAKLIYEYMIKNFKIENKLRKPSSDYTVLDMLKTKKGDAYDFAVLYAALLRTAGVPAKLMSGILVDSEKKAIPHWWVNFYLDNFGWVPVDVSLGAGLSHNAFQPVQNPATYYFGNLDSQHVLFTQNWNIVKSAISNGKSVYIPKTYATQNIWEESSQDITSYSSFWNDPTVIGIY